MKPQSLATLFECAYVLEGINYVKIKFFLE